MSSKVDVTKPIQPIRAVKGTRDLLPSETPVWQRVEEEARRVLAAYNFREIRTPVLEPTELFARSVGIDTDIVTKEMYTFQDRGEGSLTLRPEATASVVRALAAEHGAEVVELVDATLVVHRVLDVRPHHGRRRFGPQG